MINSLTIFLAFLGFLAFGYFSLLRTLYGQLFGMPYKELIKGLNGSHGLKHLGSSAFFVSLPATSLLLFWGWGPALIWLVVFHLMADSLVNLQVTAVDHKAALAEYLVGLDSSLASLMMRALLQFYLILLMAIVLTMLAKLIDKESGLLFALLGLIPAYLFLRIQHRSIPMIVRFTGSLFLLGLGFVIAQQLGFSMYGDWAPLSSLFGINSFPIEWFRLNNSTLLALILLSGAFALARNESFSDDISKLSGVFALLVIGFLIVKLIWLRPLIDAPINSASESSTDQTLPLLASFSLFLFTGLTTLFFRVFNSTAPTDDELSPAADFGRLQSESALLLILALLLVLSLGSALGIGAWKTHFMVWDSKADLLNHLNLSLSSLLNLIGSKEGSSNFIHTIVMSGFCIAGLNFLRVCIKALSLADEERSYRIGGPETLFGLLIQSKLIQALIAFILCTYFIAKGISLNSWLLVGIVAWIIVVQLITAMTVTMKKPSFARTVYGVQCLAMIALGSVQTLFISTQWAVSGEKSLAITGFTLVAIGGYLWSGPITKIISRFSSNDSINYFDLR